LHSLVLKLSAPSFLLWVILQRIFDRISVEFHSEQEHSTLKSLQISSFSFSFLWEVLIARRTQTLLLPSRPVPCRALSIQMHLPLLLALFLSVSFIHKADYTPTRLSINLSFPFDGNILGCFTSI